MRLFYQTKTQNAQSILRDGFRDSVLEVTDEGSPLIEVVRLFDDPLGWPLGVAMDGIDLSDIGDDPDSGGFAGPVGDTSPFGNN